MESEAASFQGLQPAKKLSFELLSCLDSWAKGGLPRDSPAQQHLGSPPHQRVTKESLKRILRHINVCETGRYRKNILHKQEEELNSMAEMVPQPELICWVLSVGSKNWAK